MRQVEISQTVPVVPQDRVSLYGKMPVRVMPEWPSVETRQPHRELLPYVQDFSFDMSKVTEMVQTALMEPDPEAALAKLLSSMQAAQQARLADLLESSTSAEQALLRHQHKLRANQTNYDAALKVLRLISASGVYS